MGLRAGLGPGPTALDTALFIYYIEANEAFLPLVAPIFEDVAAGRREVVTSSLTLLEVLVVPYRAGNLALASRYEAYLSGSRGVRLVDIDRSHLRTAAQLRALHPGVRQRGILEAENLINDGPTLARRQQRPDLRAELSGDAPLLLRGSCPHG